jgi:hypothetical protein
MKTNQVTGTALDWAVATAEGLRIHIWHTGAITVHFPGAPRLVPFQPSRDWSQAGPIIEREEICLKKDQPPRIAAYEWNAWTVLKSNAASGRGPTPLIAAMRCFVASKLGDEIDLPEQLR